MGSSGQRVRNFASADDKPIVLLEQQFFGDRDLGEDGSAISRNELGMENKSV